MGQKTVHLGIDPGTVSSLGITDGFKIGFKIDSTKEETVYLTECESSYNKIRDLLTTGIDDISKLSSYKKAYVLPLCNVTNARLKATLKQHGISMTTDLDKADFIIGHDNIYDIYNGMGYSTPVNKLMYFIYNGYKIPGQKNEYALMENRTTIGQHVWRMDYDSLPHDSYILTGLALEVARRVQDGELDVVNIDDVMLTSANKTPLTEDTLAMLISSVNSYSDEDVKIAAKILPTVDHTQNRGLFFKLCREVGHTILYNKFNRDKDVQYWAESTDMDRLSSLTAEDAIKYFEEEGVLDSETFKMLEPECRKEIAIYNRDLYTFTVQLKPEYRKYFKKQKNETV